MTLVRMLILVAGLFLAAPQPSHAAEPLAISLTVGETQRRALLVNEIGSRTRPVPVVIVLHGGAGSAETVRAGVRFDQLARKEGFLVVYAEGLAWGPGRHAWNTGFLMRRQVSGADDIAYLDALIDRLISDHGADPDRIYMTGASNGAMMTLVYAVHRAGRLAAIAPVVGAMFSFEATPATPLPILLINGELDNEVPSAGGFSRNPLVSRNQAAPYKSLQETVAFWVSANRSRTPPDVTQSGSVTTSVYPAMPGGADTVSVVDAQGGHGWPGPAELRRGNRPIQAFDGAERVWSFFQTKSRAR